MAGEGGSRHYWPKVQNVNVINGNLHLVLGPGSCVTCGGQAAGPVYPSPDDTKLHGPVLVYNTMGTNDTALGPKWMRPYDTYLTVDGSGNVTLIDADGRRMRSKLAGAANWTEFVHDELTGEILMEYTLVGGVFTIKAVNTWGLGLISTNREGTKRYFHFDGLGSTRALTDSSENVTDTYEYNALGVLESSSGSSVNPYRYVGQYGYYDDGAMGSVSGLLLLGVRCYSPAHGRFWSWDPVPNLNLYGYVANSATMWVDPGGEQRTTITWPCISAHETELRVGNCKPVGQSAGSAKCRLACRRHEGSRRETGTVEPIGRVRPCSECYGRISNCRWFTYSETRGRIRIREGDCECGCDTKFRVLLYICDCTIPSFIITERVIEIGGVL